jgi:hypothetical protein
MPARALHVCGDIASAGLDRRWPYAIAAEDTVQRAARICEHAGIAEQQTLRGEAATTAAVMAALNRACAALSDGGLLVLTFSGHTHRGDGPLETTRWCLFDDGLALSQIAVQLRRLPSTAKIVVICDSCYGAAIAKVLHGAPQVLVIAGCSDEQTMLDRLRSEFMVRLEDFVCGTTPRGSVSELRSLLESDTPDCERPVVWTNTDSWWSAAPIEPPASASP